MIAFGLVLMACWHAWQRESKPRELSVSLYGGEELAPTMVLGEPGGEADWHMELAREDATPPATSAPRSPEFLLELEIVVCNCFGVPVPDYEPQIALPGGSAAAVDQQTDSDGRVLVQIRSRLPKMELEICDPRGHRHLVELTANRRSAFALALEDVVSLDSRGPERVGYGGHGDKEVCYLVVGSQPSPYAQFADPHIAWVEIPDDHSSRSWISCHTCVAPRRVKGTVVNAIGDPAASIPVTLYWRTGKHSTATDAHGNFCFPEDYERGGFLRAGNQTYGFAHLRLPSYTHAVQLRLQPGVGLHGEVLDNNLLPVEAMVEWRAHDASFAAMTTTAADGRFAFDLLPAKAGRVIVYNTLEQRLPLASWEGVFPGTAGMTLKVNDQTRSKAVMHFVAGFPEDTEFQVWIQQEASRTSMLTKQRALKMVDQDVWRHVGLPAGWHRIAVNVVGYGWYDLGRHWADGRSPVELGEIRPPVAGPGRVKLLLPGDKPDEAVSVQLLQHRADCDVRVVPLPAPGTPILLPPGDYSALVAAAGESAAVQLVHFTVRAGAELVVRLPAVPTPQLPQGPRSGG